MGLHWRKRCTALGCALGLLVLTFPGCGRMTPADGNGAEKAGNDRTVQTEQSAENDDSQHDAGLPKEDSPLHGENTTKPQRGDSEEPPEEEDAAAGAYRRPYVDKELPALAVEGTQLVDDKGNSVQLRGVSTHGLAWYPGYVNEDCFAQLKEWGVDVIRLAMYTGENGGYCTGGDKDSLKKLIRDGVEYATNCGMYVIIDWHILSDGNPNTYIEESKVFFQEMSQEYADYTNVLYEICNEPNGGTSWKDVKKYAEQIIDIIRENDDDGIILVGTPNWCQYVDQAAADPIQDCENVMYTLHFYAATHTDSLRNAMVDAINAGLPIFVSEYGICDASGNGAIDRKQANQWISVMDQYEVSYVAWNLSNKGETSALIKSSCNKLSGFAAEDLSESGKWLYSVLTGTNPEQGGASWFGGSSSGSQGSGGQQGQNAGQGSQNSGNQQGQNAGQGSQQGAGNGNGSAKTLTNADGLEISASVVNSWEQDGQSCFQYSLTISNPTNTDCDSWIVVLNFNSSITLDGSWNGNYQVNGNKLTISSMDYNGAIPAGGSVGDVGFIVRGEKGLGL